MDPTQAPIRITAAYKAYCDPAWTWRNNGTRAELNLWLVTEGRGRFVTPSRVYDLRAGDVFVHRHWRASVATHDPQHPLVVPYICFEYPDDTGRASLPPDADLPRRHRRLESISFLAELMQRCIDAWSPQRPDDPGAHHWLRAALLEVRRQDGLPPAARDHGQARLIDTLCLDIQRAPARARVADLARRSGYTLDHFIRLFRSVRGMTPGEYIIQCRIKAAAELLRFSAHGVGEIAALLGYCDVYAFSKQFRQRMGVAPRVWRQRT